MPHTAWFRRVPLALLTATALTIVSIAAAGCGGGGGSGSTVPVGVGEPPPPPPPPPPVSSSEIADLVVEPGTSDGEVILRFAAPSMSDGSTVLSYDVRSEVRHLVPSTIANAPVVPQAHTPVTPGLAEALVLTGLERGQTFQFAVRAVSATGAGTWSMRGHGVSGRVPGKELPVQPGNAINVTAPGALNQENGYYVLQNDIHAGGTAFTIEARGITLDLNGYTVYYGESNADDVYGVFSRWLYSPRHLIQIVNGTFQYNGNGGANCNAVYFEGGWDVSLLHLRVIVNSADARGIWLEDMKRGEDSMIRISHCHVSLQNPVVVNRHQGIDAINVAKTHGGVEVDHCLVDEAPHWAIRVAGDTTRPGNDVLIHHNRVIGTRAMAVNGYMLGIHKPHTEAFENYLDGENPGIHIDGEWGAGNDVKIHDNVVRAWTRPNAEANPYHCHGIKVEQAHRAQIYNNDVLVRSDASHGNAFALDVDLMNLQDLDVRHNRIAAVASDSVFTGEAVRYTQASQTPQNLHFEENVFEATDRFVDRGWDSGGPGATFAGNAWLRDLSQGVAHPFAFERFGHSDAIASTGHDFVNPWTREDVTQISHSWTGVALYDSARTYDLCVLVRDAAGAAVASASVTVTDTNGQVAVSGTSDAAGRLTVQVARYVVSHYGVVTDNGPFTVRVTHGAQVHQDVHPIDGMTSLLVDLDGDTSAADTEAPASVAEVTPYVLSPARCLVAWDAAQDNVGVAGYLVYANGRLVGITTETSFVVNALVPGDAYVFEVETRDVSDLLSPASATGSVQMPPLN